MVEKRGETRIAHEPTRKKKRFSGKTLRTQIIRGGTGVRECDDDDDDDGGKQRGRAAGGRFCQLLPGEQLDRNELQRPDTCAARRLGRVKTVENRAWRSDGGQEGKKYDRKPVEKRRRRAALHRTATWFRAKVL